MKKTLIWTIIGVVAILIIAGLVIYNATQKEEEVELPIIRVATNKVPYSVPYIVATNKDYFKEQGLDVQTEIVATGREGLDALIGGSVEITFVAETPMVHLGFESSDVNIFATVGEGPLYDLVARKDQGVLQPSDLKGEKIGTQKGTAMEFFTLKFLEDNGISPEDVEIQNVGIREAAPALLRGDFDVITSWEPMSTEITEQLGEDAIVFKIDRPSTWNLAARKEFLKNNPEVIKKFLLAMIKAEDCVRNNEEETNNIVSEFTGFKKEILGKVWERFDFKVILKDTLLDLLKGQGEWILESREEAGEIPNYRALINEKSLQEIDPERVSL